jgi:DNA repair exonuclease SbcCD nuclease subunit
MVIMSTTTKIAIFTDLHLGVHQNSDYWLQVSVDWVNWFVFDLKQKGITTVIFCGDWMHYRDAVEVKTLHYHSIILDKFKDFELVMIPGNHCCYHKNTSNVHSMSIMKHTKNVKIYDTITTWVYKNKDLTFCPWGCNINDIPKSDVIFGHFELQTFKMNGFKVCEHGDDPEKLIYKAPLIFSGHFHQRDEKRFDTSTIIYIGNPFQTDFGDAYQTKGYYILDLDTLSYTFIENKLSPKHIKFSLSEIINHPDPLRYFKDNIPTNIIKVVIDKSISTEHLDLLTNKVLTYKPADFKIDFDVNYNKIKISEEAKQIDSNLEIENIITEFVNLLDLNNKKEIIEYTLALYKKAADEVR